MVMPAGGLEFGAIAARGAKRAIGQIEHDRDLVRRTRIGEADAPRVPIAMTAERADLTAPHIREKPTDAMVAQHLRDPVGDIALGDAVEGQSHSGFGQADAPGIDIDTPPIDKRERPVDRRPFGPVRRGRGRAEEMGGIDIPERLHRDVEGAFAQRGEALALRQQRQQILGRRREPALPVEARDLAVAAVEAEDPLEPLDLGGALADEPIGGGTIPIIEQNARRRAERGPVPAVKRHRRLSLIAAAQQGQAGQRSEDGHDPSAREGGGRRGHYRGSASRGVPSAGSAAAPGRCARRLRRQIMGGQV